MAKKSSIDKNQKRIKLTNSKQNKRSLLKSRIMDKSTSSQERMDLVFKLSQMPRSSSKVRIRNRCGITGRPRGFYRFFGLSRNKLRELSGECFIPGLIKSSW
ncbi:MAG TPA: 30S ribosomal protein S14 [Candidatus Megaira endosymbiont of Hartmannula sinica]|nr:30S ribosomal protein S14 [Candidatus Megaera endosymbiont of Hartmannula sinica]